VAHRRAKLTPLGRSILVERVLVEGWSASAVAEAMGVSRATVYKWLRRFQAEGPAGLNDRTSAPHRRPRALSRRQVARILRARDRLGWGPHRLGPALGHPRSTVYGVLRRAGAPRLGETDRPTRTPIRYERERPGELVHLDVKKLGKIPSGGGWRKLGRSHQTRLKQNERRGYDYVHVAVDDHSRLAHVEVLPDERGATCARFLQRAAERFAEAGISQIERVMTDNAWSYTHSRDFRDALVAIGARHRPIPPYRPQLNGKAERLNRTLLEEWAYVRLYRSNGARTASLSRWLDAYNRRRPHTALGGRPPISRVSTT
jgi:transposase InsO family protein